MVSTRRSGSLSGNTNNNNSKRSSSSEDKPPSPKRQKVFFFFLKKWNSTLKIFDFLFLWSVRCRFGLGLVFLTESCGIFRSRMAERNRLKRCRRIQKNCASRRRQIRRKMLRSSEKTPWVLRKTRSRQPPPLMLRSPTVSSLFFFLLHCFALSLSHCAQSFIISLSVRFDSVKASRLSKLEVESFVLFLF